MRRTRPIRLAMSKRACWHSGAVSSISRVLTLIGDGFEKAKWFLIVLLALVLVLLLARVTRLCLVAAQEIKRIIKGVTK